MQARPPPQNVILKPNLISLRITGILGRCAIQVRVDTRNFRVQHGVRETRQPTLGPPLVGILAPECLAGI